MDLFFGLPLSKYAKSIMNMVEKATVRLIIVPFNKIMVATEAFNLFLYQVVRCYGKPLDIIANCDPCFISMCKQ